MINSLFKDSHITRKSRFSKSHLLQSGAPLNNYKSAATDRTMNSSDIIVKKPAEISFSGLSCANKLDKLCTNKWFKNMLIEANENPVLFGAGVALVLTCVFRPLSIILFPGSNKNSDDKKYAAAHSIASGVIGFGLAFVLVAPINAAIDKIKNKTSDYIKKNTDLFLKDKKKLLNTSETCLKQIPDIVFAPPKAILTIAILAPILKNVFGLTKKKKANSESAIPNYSMLNFKSTSLPQRNSMQSFMGGAR